VFKGLKVVGATVVVVVVIGVNNSVVVFLFLFLRFLFLFLFLRDLAVAPVVVDGGAGVVTRRFEDENRLVFRLSRDEVGFLDEDDC
jgi:hypothetical protein